MQGFTLSFLASYAKVRILMKIFLFVTLIILTVLLALNLTNGADVSAKETPRLPAVEIHNHTGGLLTLTLEDATGEKNVTQVAGTLTLPLNAGPYHYSASTPCGSQSGSFTLASMNLLYFSCKENSLSGQTKSLSQDGVCVKLQRWDSANDSIQLPEGVKPPDGYGKNGDPVCL